MGVWWELGGVGVVEEESQHNTHHHHHYHHLLLLPSSPPHPLVHYFHGIYLVLLTPKSPFCLLSLDSAMGLHSGVVRGVDLRTRCGYSSEWQVFARRVGSGLAVGVRRARPEDASDQPLLSAASQVQLEPHHPFVGWGGLALYLQAHHTSQWRWAGLLLRLSQ